MNRSDRIQITPEIAAMVRAAAFAVGSVSRLAAAVGVAESTIARMIVRENESVTRGLLLDIIEQVERKSALCAEAKTKIAELRF